MKCEYCTADPRLDIGDSETPWRCPECNYVNGLENRDDN